ncbi:MAG: hypothetical protein R3302_09040 [Sulfurimonadaceae bacterium]|nr:hypothetical protein [Sulfurimonadaceae bacterium]
MKKTGIGIDYSNICKDYNTAYLDRDNKDPATSRCMKSVAAWTHGFLTELLEEFGYKVYRLNSSVSVTIDEVASNRFLFFSLEKGITLQSYVIEKEYTEYDSLSAWEEQSDGILIKNDEDGEGIYFYLNENSDEHQWIIKKLADFSLDEVPFQAK